MDVSGLNLLSAEQVRGLAHATATRLELEAQQIVKEISSASVDYTRAVSLKSSIAAKVKAARDLRAANKTRACNLLANLGVSA